jgi:hypothetical protein
MTGDLVAFRHHIVIAGGSFVKNDNAPQVCCTRSDAAHLDTRRELAVRNGLPANRKDSA